MRIDARDNVAVALEEIAPATPVVAAGAAPVESAGSIPFAHKVALAPIAKGAPIVKYGAPIAFATTDIAPGEWVDRHNAKSYFVAKREEAKP